MKAFLLCSCALVILSSSFSATSTNAGDFPLFDTATSVMPSNDQNAPIGAVADTTSLASAVSAQRPVDWQSAEQTKTVARVLPSDTGMLPATERIPGENPFAKGDSRPVNVQPADRHPQGQERPIALAVPAHSPATLQIPANVENPFVSRSAEPVRSEARTNETIQTPVKVDETALRYYASTQDLKRLGAELRRLKSLYPEWETPENLFDPVTTVQEQPLWDIYATGNYASVRAELSRLQTANPQWKPSKDLLLKLRLAETRKVIDRSYSQKNWRQIIQMGEETPELLVCANINVLWQVGEALAHTRDYARSFDLYKYILTTCSIPEERLSTVQKASLVLPEAGLQSLIALGTIQPDGSSEFEAIGFDPLRRKMGQMASRDPLATPITMTELEIFSSYVQRTGSGNDAGLFGWYHYSLEDYEASHAWFTAAMRMTNDPKNVEGVVLSLRNMNKAEEAMAFAKRYGKNAPLVTKEYIEIVAAALTSDKPEIEISEKELKDFEKTVFATKSATGAQALGWMKLKEKDTKAAKELFKTSLSWEPTEGGVVGSAVIATRANDRATLAALKQSYGKQYASLDKLSIYGKKRVQGNKKIKQKKTLPNFERKTLFTLLFSK